MHATKSYVLAHSDGNFYSGAAHMYRPGPSNTVGVGSTNNIEPYAYYNMGLASGFNASALSQGWMGGHPSGESAAMESLRQSGALEGLTWEHMEPIAE